mmetsp:Transcript_33423/g.51305  ORF Transcript_33423/g.51305 Transcript_33423/m.51305 type:complete len:125 (+) Transcript_33423:697-1071(+)
MEAAAMESKENREEFVALTNENLDDDDEFDYDNQPEYLYMELKSTSSFQDVDIDSMLEHTSFDDFMRGMYMSKVADKPTGKVSAAEFNEDVDDMMMKVFTMQKDDFQSEADEFGLQFDDADKIN